MKLEKQFKPSFHLQNAPYRGELKLTDYMNMVMEITHDMVLADRILNERHLPQIHQNFASLVTGEVVPVHFNHFNSSTLFRLKEKDALSLPLFSEWHTIGSPILDSSIQKGSIESATSTDTIGIYTSIYAEAGQSLYFRVKVKANTAVETFTIGSNTIQTAKGTGAFKTVSLKEDEERFVDLFLEPATDQTISLVIYVRYKPSILVPNEQVQVLDWLICPAVIKEVVPWSYEQAMNELEQTKDLVRKIGKNEVTR